jgi:hypothetical protein
MMQPVWFAGPTIATLTVRESESGSKSCATHTPDKITVDDNEIKYDSFFKIQWELSLSSAHERVVRE